MAGRRALSRYWSALGRLALAGAALSAAIAVFIIASPRAAAVNGFPTGGDDSCVYPVPASTSLHSTLQVVVNGVDSPVFKVTTTIDVPESWPGTDGLFEEGEAQGRSLVCFLPIDQYNYQVDPPAISVVAATATRPPLVHVTNTVTVTDGPESGWWQCETSWQCWHVGLWNIQKTSSGYAVAFPPAPGTELPGLRSWTVALEARDLNVLEPKPRPTTDDGNGALIWSIASSGQGGPSITASLDSPWQVRMNLASDRWWPRFVSDSTWTLDDGVAFAIILLLISLRLRRRWSGKEEKRRLANGVILIAWLSIACYAWYVGDDYLWHRDSIFGLHLDDSAIWELENAALVGVSVLYFVFALWVSKVRIDGRRRCAAAFSVVTLAAAVIALTPPPAPSDTPVVCVALIPLLWAVTLFTEGTWLWIRYTWQLGNQKPQGHHQGDQDDRRPRRLRPMGALVAGPPLVSVLILGQSAASVYYYWAHTDWWRQGDSAFTYIAENLLNDSHWWIGDGIQWWLYFALFAGILALLKAGSDEARGVFLAPDEATESGDLWRMAALVGCLFIGTWGYYAGFAIPLPLIVTYICLRAWGLTCKLSELDRRSFLANASDRDAGRPEDPRNSLLITYRKDLLAAARAASKDPAANPRAGITPSAGSPPERDLLIAKIPLESSSPHDLVLKSRVDPGATALALGPEDTWWCNGETAVRIGAYLVIVPIGFDVFIAWNSGSLSLRNFPFGLQDTVGYVASVALAWMTGLFLFGVLVPYLRGMRTPLKGVTFGLIAFAAYAADAGVRHALGVAPYPTYVVDGLLAVVLFTVTGLLLDFRTLRDNNRQPLLGTIYRLGSVRVIVTSVTAVVVVGLSLWQAIYLTDQTAQQRAQNFSNAAQYTGSTFGKN